MAIHSHSTRKMISKDPRLINWHISIIRILRANKTTHMISPVHLPRFPQRTLTSGFCKERNASSKRWIKAVARITPVPKCFPIKKTTAGMRNIGICLDIVGNDTAINTGQGDIHSRQMMNQPISETKNIINITSMRGSTGFMFIKLADGGQPEATATLEKLVGMIIVFPKVLSFGCGRKS